MKYAVDYRSMHTAIHGLILFDTRKKAENAYQRLKVIDKVETDNDYDLELSDVLNTSFTIEEDFDYREFKEVIHGLKYFVNDNGRVYPKRENTKIINFEQSIDLYC